LVQNHDDVLCHTHQAVIVSPIDGGTNHCMMAVCATLHGTLQLYCAHVKSNETRVDVVSVAAADPIRKVVSPSLPHKPLGVSIQFEILALYNGLVVLVKATTLARSETP
jgi:hypothetical protein